METSNDDSVLYEDSFQTMKVAELKLELKAKNLPTNGTKSELINRLIEATSATKDAQLFDADPDGDVGTDDEILDDLVPDSSTKELSIFVLEEKLSPEAPAPEPKVSRKRAAVTVGNGVEKKVCLNRDTPLVPPPATEDVSTHPRITMASDDAADSISAKKSLSAQEKLALRAERFSIKSTGTIKLKVTDKGNEKPLSPTETKASIKPITFSNAPNLDKLKQRAERFGVVSSLLKKIEEKDKVKQRQIRFGASAAAAASTSDAMRLLKYSNLRRGTFMQNSREASRLRILAKRASRFTYISPAFINKMANSKLQGGGQGITSSNLTSGTEKTELKN